MEFNPSKCEAITFTRKTRPVKAKYNLHGTTLETVTSAKYLGVHISSKLTWNEHTDISIYYVLKVDVQWRDSTFATSPQTYTTAAFGEGQVREGTNLPWLRCHVAASRHSSGTVQRASCEPLTAVAEQEDIILR